MFNLNFGWEDDEDTQETKVDKKVIKKKGTPKNPEFNETDNSLQLILKSSCMGRLKDPDNKFQEMKGFLDWVALENKILFPDSNISLLNKNLLTNDELREKWEEYSDKILNKIFPDYPQRYIVRKSGLNENNEEWILFPHPEDAITLNLVDSNNRIPSFRFIIKEWIDDYTDEKTSSILGIGFITTTLSRIHQFDGLLFTKISWIKFESGEKFEDTPSKFINFIKQLKNTRKETAMQLKKWEEYIEWEKEHCLKEEWGGLVTDVKFPIKDDINWIYKIQIPIHHYRKVKKSKNTMLYVAPKSESKNDTIWERTDEERGSKSKIHYFESEDEIGKLVDIKKGKEMVEFIELILTIIPPDPDEPGKVPEIEPNEFFIVNNVALDMIQFDRQEKAIKRLKDQEAVFNNVQEWIFDIQKAQNNPLALPELQYDLLPGTNLNENQLLSVKKALAARDVCLIQGPPGTGKTTVIAEIINQATQDGMKILLASQTNLAVDNALGRLGYVPNVRPIRRHSRSAAQDLDAEKFIENNVVKEFFIPSIKKQSKRVQNEDERLIKINELCNNFKSESSKIYDQWMNLDNDSKEIKMERKKIQSKILSFEKERLNFENRKEKVIVLENAIKNNTYLDLPDEHIIFVIGDINKVIELRNIHEQELYLPILKNVLDLSADSENLTGATNNKILSLRKERDSIDKYSTNEKELKRLLEINKEIKMEEEKSIESKWPKWSGKLHDSLNKLQNYDKYRNNKNVINAMKEVQSTFPRESLKNNIGELKKQIQSDLEMVNVNIKRGSQLKKDYIENLEKRILIEKERLDKEINRRTENIHINKDNIDKCDKKIESITNKINYIEETWNKHINNLKSDFVTDGLNISQQSIDIISDQISNWKRRNNKNLQKAKNWKNVREEWLGELDNPNDEVLKDLQDTYQDLINIEGVTLSFCAKKRWYQKYAYDPFDLVIIDEVSKATPPELLQALLLGKRIILIGDHKQLPPTFTHHGGNVSVDGDLEVAAREQEDSERLKKYEPMVTSSLFKKHFINADDSIKEVLNVQYRMHDQIMDCVNTFYNWKLENGWSKTDQELKKSHGFRIKKLTDWSTIQKGSDIITESKHVVWIDSSLNRQEKYQPEYQYREGTSKANIREIEIASHLLDEIEKNVFERKKSIKKERWKKDQMLQHLDINQKLPIGFITFYGGQIGQFKETALDNKGWDYAKRKWPNLNLKVNSVDRFQGGERPIIMVSTVVSPKIPEHMKASFEKQLENKGIKVFSNISPYEGGIPPPTTGFVRSFERINVALSRAQNLLIIIGNKWGLEKVEVNIPDDRKSIEKPDRIYRRIQNIINRYGGMIDGREFI